MSVCLVVEDSRLARKEIISILNEINIFEQILEAENAEDAKLMLEKHDPDVVFLDIHLPGMNGFEFLESATDEIGEEFAGAVIVMLTTSLNPADQERAMSFEVVRDFINKPLTEEHVLGVSNMLAS